MSVHSGGVRRSTLTPCLWDEVAAAHWVAVAHCCVLSHCIMSVTTVGPQDERSGIAGSSISLFQVQDVYAGKIIGALKTADNFSVIINPSGVVMWYLRPMALLVQPWHVVRQQAPSKGFRPAIL